jgi:hypothetical protein
VGNKISSWRDIDVLNDFPQLSAFRVQNNPLTQELPEEASWSALLSRTPSKITRINGSAVKEVERVDNRKYYLKLWIFEQNGLNAPSTSPLSLVVREVPPERFIETLRRTEPEIASITDEQVCDSLFTKVFSFRLNKPRREQKKCTQLRHSEILFLTSMLFAMPFQEKLEQQQ